METTRIIGNAVGIQYQGVTDQSGSAPAGRLVNGLIVGDFGRGRVDQPMFITKDTLAQLGDESKPAYKTVADCLDTGVPGVWVVRVGGGGGGGGECIGAINGVSFTASAYSFFSDGTVWSLISNGTTISATWLDSEMLGNSNFISVNFGSFITADFGDNISFESISSNELHIIITNPSADFSEIEEIDFNEQNDRNQTLIISENEVKFCLVPN